MSIASASLVPTLPVNGIKFLNPALASSALSTDANGNVVAGGSTGFRGQITAPTTDQGGNNLTNGSYLVIDDVNNLVYIFLQITMTGAQLSNNANLPILTMTTTANPVGGQIPPLRSAYSSPLGIPVRCGLNVSAGSTLQDYVLRVGGANQIQLVCPEDITINPPQGGGNYVLTGTIIYPYQ